jgi:molecular chaperone GrpE
MKTSFTKSGLRAHSAFEICEAERPIAARQEGSPALIDLLQRSIQEMERIGKGLYRLSLTQEALARQAPESALYEMRRRQAEDYLPVMDALERLAHALSTWRDTGPEGAVSLAPLAEGARIVEQKGSAYLQTMGVQPIEAVGALFDPTLHEAIERKPVSLEMSGRVLQEVVRGYRIGDKVLRTAQVVVGVPEQSLSSANLWNAS